MKRDILFLCQFFYPEYNSSATLPFDTAQYLANNGYTVDALCGYPREYTKEKSVPLRECKDKIGIHRLRYLQFARGGKFGRLINYFSFTLSALAHVAELKRYQIVIVYSNPPVLPIVAILANILFGTKFVFVAYDIYPEVAYASHSLEPGGIIDTVMQSINRQLYRRAARIIVLTEEMRQFVLQHRPEADASRMCVIPNWAHEGTMPATKEAYQHFGYTEGSFIVSHFGNMGVCQDIETLLAAMQLLRDDDQIQFLIAGHGSKLPALKEATKDFKNVKMLDFLLGEEFEQALAISSCGIVSLEKGLIGTCAPSKYYSYLQSGCPVIVIAEENSYLAVDVKEQRSGYSVANGEAARLAGVIKMLSSDRQRQIAAVQQALLSYESLYDKAIAMSSYGDTVKELIDGN